MRTLFIALMLLAFAIPSSAQRKNLNKFYRKYKYTEGARGYSFPGWLLKMGTGIAQPFVKDEEAKLALKFARRFKRMRFLVMEDQNNVRPSDMKFMVNGIKQGKKPFDDFIQVRNGKTRVNFMIREKKGAIRDIMIMVSEEDTFVLMDIKAKLRMEDINKLIQQLSDEMDVDIPIKPIPKSKKKDRPQV